MLYMRQPYCIDPSTVKASPVTSVYLLNVDSEEKKEIVQCYQQFFMKFMNVRQNR